MSRLRGTAFAVAASALLLSAAPTIAVTQRPNPSQQETENYRRRGPCRDPWISIAVVQVNSGVRDAYGAGDAGECNPAQYAGGRWSSFDELYRAVDFRRADLRLQGLEYFGGPLNGNKFVVIRKITSRDIVAATLVGNDGSSLQFSMSQMVAAGAGNVVGQNAAAMVAAGAGNMVAAGGGNFIIR